MSTLFWLVVLYYVGRRWLKKSPAARDYLKLLIGGHTAGRARKIAEPKPASRTGSPGTIGAHKPQPPVMMGKKAEKQFRQL